MGQKTPLKFKMLELTSNFMVYHKITHTSYLDSFLPNCVVLKPITYILCLKPRQTIKDVNFDLYEN